MPKLGISFQIWFFPQFWGKQEDALRRLRGMYWFSKNYVEWRWKVEKCINNKCVQLRAFITMSGRTA